MPYKENLKRASQLKEELDTFRPLSAEVEQRIMQKFRLDWNYHSANIEGNKLTFGETKALIMFGMTAQAKPLKDHLEMTGHDEAIKWLVEDIKQGIALTEKFIRELHVMILKEPYESKAVTADGQSTTRTIAVGQYKTAPNHVVTKTGETFHFASPEETPVKMRDLLQWYNDNKDKEDLHPVVFATEFHYRFISIHPFDDGNGRLARLLMNFILMQKGYPPAIVKTEDKENYMAALQQADAGELAYFFNYICEQVNRSLELMIKGAKGESIDEEDDLDKKLALLKQDIEKEDDENEIKDHLTYGAIKNALESWGYDLVTQLANTTSKFNEFYDKPAHTISLNLDGKGPYIKFDKNPELDKIQSLFSRAEVKTDNGIVYSKTPTGNSYEDHLPSAEISFQTSFSAYKKGGLNPFGCNYRLDVKFEQYHYELILGVFDTKAKNRREISFAKKLLHQPITKDELKEINKLWGESLFNHLEYHRKQLKENGSKQQ
ncbi:MAG: Fic family protein [Marinilabiliaceae bacterium]|nr:Fic family protein [Marinilabiliaceae bacterium]